MLERTSSRAARAAVARVSVLIGLALAAACGQGVATGPEEIHWDRQTCEHCRMVISERVHAAQIRLPGEPRTHAFDDLGCALLWLDARASIGKGDARLEAAEVWVRDPSGSEWIDGRTSRYVGGLATPMAYGYGVAAEGEGESLATVRERIRETERLRRGDDRGQRRGIE